MSFVSITIPVVGIELISKFLAPFEDSTAQILAVVSSR